MAMVFLILYSKTHPVDSNYLTFMYKYAHNISYT